MPFLSPSSSIQVWGTVSDPLFWIFRMKSTDHKDVNIFMWQMHQAELQSVKYNPSICDNQKDLVSIICLELNSVIALRVKLAVYYQSMHAKRQKVNCLLPLFSLCHWLLTIGMFPARSEQRVSEYPL